MKKVSLQKRYISSALLFLLFILWEVLVRLDFIPAALFPSPSLILRALYESPQLWKSAFLQTTTNALIGFILSTLLGGGVAIFVTLVPSLGRGLLPLSVFFQTIPIVAIAPLLVIYFGFGAPTVIASSFIVSVFPIIASLIVGLQSVAPEKIDLFRLYGSSRWDLLLKLQIPSSLTYFYSGLQVTAGLAIVGAVAGEFVAGSGLGSIIDSAKSAQRVDQVFASFILLSIIGLSFLRALRDLFLFLLQKRPFFVIKTVGEEVDEK